MSSRFILVPSTPPSCFTLLCWSISSACECFPEFLLEERELVAHLNSELTTCSPYAYSVLEHIYGADHHAGSYKRNLYPQRLVLSDCTIHAINMIGKNHAVFLALLAIVSAVASGQPARDYENIHPFIVSKTLQSQHEKRAPQGEEQDEVYQIECRMRRTCHPAPKTSSPTQDPAAKSTSTTSIDQSILDWVSILNAPGPVVTELPQVITTSTNNMDRDITSEDSSALKTIAVTYPVQSPSRLWPMTS